MTTSRELEGRVALVTGGARNIGRAIALALAEGGAAVVVNCRKARADAEAVVAEIEGRGGKALCHVADVTDEAGVAQMVKAATARFGRLDFLVNNAAVRDVTPIDGIDLATWRHVTGVILDGAFICAKAAIPEMRRAGGGSIVNIGGMSGHTGAAGRAHVGAAKLGLVGFARSLAHDLGRDHITVNTVVPGLIDTVRAGSSSTGSAHKREGLLERRGQPEEVAAVVRMLCGPGGRYVTGQTWHVNGGAFLA